MIHHKLTFKDFMNCYKKRTAKLYYFFVTDTTLTSDNSSHLRKNLLERIKVDNAIDDKIIDEKYNMTLKEKQQKYRHYLQVKLINMNILQMKKQYHLIQARSKYNQLEQAKFTYSLLGKAFEKQIKTIKQQGKKQVLKL